MIVAMSSRIQATRRRFGGLIALIGTLLLVTGCGGGGGASATATPVANAAGGLNLAGISATATQLAKGGASVGASPSTAPTAAPTVAPTVAPTAAPTVTVPTVAPTTAPTATRPAATVVAAAATQPATASVATASRPASGSPTASLVRDPQGHFTFARPQGWTDQSLPKPNVLVHLTSSRPTVDFRVQVNDTTLTLAQFSEQNQAGLKTALSGYEAGPLNNKATTLGGEPAVINDSFAVQNGTKLRLYEILLKRSGTLYSLTLITDVPPTDPAAVLKVVTDSWKFL